jgi:Domain of unknown function (DUF6285)
MSLYGRPTAGELVAAVEEFLRADVLPSVEGRVQFHTLVAANVLAIVGRELDLGSAPELAHQGRLAALGVTDDAELARAIRDGRMDDRAAELLAVLRQSVQAKLEVASPKYSPKD